MLNCRNPLSWCHVHVSWRCLAHGQILTTLDKSKAGWSHDKTVTKIQSNYSQDGALSFSQHAPATRISKTRKNTMEPLYEGYTVRSCLGIVAWGIHHKIEASASSAFHASITSSSSGGSLASNMNAPTSSPCQPSTLATKTNPKPNLAPPRVVLDSTSIACSEQEC